MTRFATRYLSILLASSAMSAGPALAQDAGPPPAPAAAAADVAMQGGNEIVVTAQRREQRLQDVPLSVSALSRESLEQAGVQSVSSIGTYVPNLQINQTVGNTFGPLITIRGLAPSADTSLARDQPVGIYVDGVPIAKSTGAAFDLVDLERVEVLRGPQGTLYGKNTIGGAVNLVTRKPTGEFGGEVLLGVGRFGLGTQRLSVNLPQIGDSDSGFGSLKAKVAGSARQYTGYYKNAALDNHFGEEDRWAGRVDLLWEMGDISVGYAYDVTDSVGTPSILAISAPGSLAANNPLIAPYIYTKRPKTISAQSALDSDFHVEGHAVTAEWDTSDALTLKSITAWRGMRTHSASDFDGTPNDLLRIILDNDYNQFSQELQAIGTVGDFNYTVGGFYMNDDYSVYNPRWNFQLGRNFFDLSERGAESYSIAGYGQLTWSPAALDNKLDIAVGLRWTKDHKKTRELFISNTAYAANPSSPTAGVYQRTATGAPVTRSGQPAIGARPGGAGIGPSDLIPVEGEKSWSEFTPELNISYEIDPTFNIYGRVATGFKSGGFNDTAATNAAFFAPYDPEKLLSYELGAKGSMFDRRLNFTAAVYHSIYKDFQAGLFVPALVTTNIINAGKALFTGFEIEGQLRPVDSLQINFGYGYLDARYKEFTLPTGVDVADTYKIPLAPKHNYLIGGTHTLPLGSVDLVSSLNYSWRSSQWTTITGDVLSKRKAYGVLDGRIALAGIRIGDKEELEFSIWGKNLTDEKYWVSGINLSTFTVRQWAEPRSYGAEVRLKF